MKALDLGVVVPLLLVAGVGLLRRPGRPGVLRYAVAGWSTMLGAAVAGMAVVMMTKGDAGASVGMTTAFSVFAVVMGVVTLLALRPLLGLPLAVGSSPRGRGSARHTRDPRSRPRAPFKCNQ